MSAARIGAAKSKIEVWVIPVDEAALLAEEAWDLLKRSNPGGAIKLELR